MAKTDDHRRNDWVLLAYLAGRFKAPVATYCVLSGVLPLLILFLQMTFEPRAAIGSEICVTAAMSPAALGIISFHNLWHLVLGQLFVIDAAPILRLTSDGRRLYRGIAGAVLCWTLAAWAAAIPGLVFVAYTASRPAEVCTATVGGLGLLLLFQAAVMPVRVLSLTNPNIAGLLTTLLFAAFLFGTAATAYFTPVQFLSAAVASPAGALGLLTLAVAASIAASRFAERWVGTATGDAVGYRMKSSGDRTTVDQVADTQPAKRRRKSGRRWARWPIADMAFRRAFFESNGLMVIMVATVLPLALAIFNFAGGFVWTWKHFWASIEEHLHFTAGGFILTAAIAIAIGPMRSVSGERERLTFPLLVLSSGLRRSALALAAGTLLGIIALILPAIAWYVSRAVLTGSTPSPLGYVAGVAVIGLIALISTYGLWAALRTRNFNQAVGLVLTAILVFPMLLAAPLLLRRQLKHELVTETT